MTKDEAKCRATAATAIALGMEAAADAGVPDGIILEETIKVALGLIGAANGGPDQVPEALRRMADALDATPTAPPTMN